ncbi:type II secretion system F family protein [Candidatus Dependentiae bacterium]|nr:type II secretion system F family protein [Candidatus Dependentiae bacterium]
MFGLITQGDILNFFIQLKSYFHAGVNLPGALSSISASSSNKKLKVLIKDLSERILKGITLNEAITRTGLNKCISDWEIALIKVGEEAGNLEDMLSTIISLKEERLRNRRKMIGGLLYPAILLHAGAVILPIARIIKTGFWGYLGNVMLILGGVYGTIFLFWLIRKLSVSFDKGNLFEKMLFSFRINKFMTFSKFFQSMKVLFEAGIPVKDIFIFSSNTSGNKFFESRVKKHLSGLRDYNISITDFIKGVGLFPQDTIGFISAGEVSGSLEKIFAHLSKDFLEKGNHRLKILMTVLPIVVFLIVALVVAINVISGFSGTSNYLP